MGYGGTDTRQIVYYTASKQCLNSRFKTIIDRFRSEKKRV